MLCRQREHDPSTKTYIRSSAPTLTGLLFIVWVSNDPQPAPRCQNQYTNFSGFCMTFARVLYHLRMCNVAHMHRTPISHASQSLHTIYGMGGAPGQPTQRTIKDSSAYQPHLIIGVTVTVRQAYCIDFMLYNFRVSTVTSSIPLAY